MTTLDMLIALVLVFSAVTGFRSGLVVGVWALAAWGLGLLIADAAQGRIAPLIAPSLGAFGVAAPVLAFMVALIVAEAALALVGRLMIAPIRAIVRSNALTGTLDKLLGVVPGIARGALICAVALVAARSLPVDTTLRTAIEGSTIARMLADAVDAARGIARP